MSASTAEDEGKAIAKALGVIYTGPQYYNEELYCHLFTDPLTGGTFGATTKGNAWARFFKLREDFDAPMPDDIPPEWKEFVLRFRGNLTKGFREMGLLPANSAFEYTPLVLERFPYPAPREIELGGDIGKLKMEIPPPRGSKVEEGSVIRTSKKHDKAVEHLGYYSVSLSDDERKALKRDIPTDVEVINDSQKRLRETRIIPDDQLDFRQRTNLNLAREIARGVNSIPPGGIHAAVIPPASERVRTAGLYGTKSGALYLSADILYRGRETFDTLIHELGHHCQFTGTGEAEDLTPVHADAMKNIAEKLTRGLNSGAYDKLLKDIQY